MKNKQLLKEFNKENGFWVRLDDLEMEHRTGIAAKVMIKEGFLTLYTLLNDAPAINIYNSNQFVFCSTEDDVLLKLKGKGEIYDWWEEDDNYESAEDFTERYMKVWNLDKKEYEKYINPTEIINLPELKITGLIQE